MRENWVQPHAPHAAVLKTRSVGKGASVLFRLPLANVRGWEALILSRDHRERLSILSWDTTPGRSPTSSFFLCDLRASAVVYRTCQSENMVYNSTNPVKE